MNYKGLEIPVASTARSRIVAALTREILINPETKTFSIGSEKQLCGRFDVSRVTVRLALNDLEHRGLIYRKHGKGTFAYGHGTRVHRNIAVLFKSPQDLEQAPLIELIRGAQSIMAMLRAALLLISSSPMEWRSETTNSLGGVIIIPEFVTIEELGILKNHKLQYLSIGDSHLPRPRIIPIEKGFSFFHAGRQAAEMLSRAATTGEYVGGLNSDSCSGEETCAGSSVQIIDAI